MPARIGLAGKSAAIAALAIAVPSSMMIAIATLGFGIPARDLTLSVIDAGVAMLIASFLGYRHGEQIRNRLARLDETLQRLQDGDHGARATIGVHDAGGELADRVNRLVTAASGREKRIIENALLDPLTGLHNRTLLTDRIRNAISVSQRTKESAHDYRYFPEPDLVPLAVDEAWEARIRASLPELPQARWRRFQEAYGLSPYDAEVLTASRAMADYFEATVAAGAGAKPAANWIMGDLQALLVKNGLPVEECKVASGELAAMIRLIDDGTISGKIAKDILLEMFDTGQSPTSIVEAKGLIQISDESELERIVAEVVAGNPGPVEDFRNGKEKALGFLVGQAMKASRGKANPKMINEMLLKALEN